MRKYSIEIKWAILFAIISLTWMLFENQMGWHDQHIDKQAVYTNFFAIPAIALFVIALFDKRKNYYGGYMTWKQGFMTGLLITVLIMILSPLIQYITSTFISPEYFKNVTDYVVSTGEMDRAAAEKNFNLKNYMMMSMVGAVIMGLVTSAIVALFTKRLPKT